MKVLVIQGAGMNMRGKVDIEIFGSMTLEQLNDTIRGYATAVGVDVEFCHSNIEGEVVNALYDAHDRDVDAAVINPAGYSARRVRCQPRSARFDSQLSKCTSATRSRAVSRRPRSRCAAVRSRGLVRSAIRLPWRRRKRS